MDLEKIKARALEIAPEIDGWDLDGDFLWATYPADGPLGKVIGIDMKHGGNIAIAIDDADFAMTSADLSDAAGVTKGRIRQLAPDMLKEGIATKDRHGRWAFKGRAVDWIAKRPRVGETIIDETIGDYGTPGQNYDVLKIRVKVTRTGFIARSVAESGSNQGFAQADRWYAEFSGRGETISDALEELTDRLSESGLFNGEKLAAVRSIVAEYEAESDS